MSRAPRSSSSRAARSTAVAALFATAALVSLPALAQYKVVGPDGKVTFTDRPPVEKDTRVAPVSASPGAAPATANLPYELRQVVQKYPVVLYTGPDCTTARQQLQSRGIPFTERTLVTPSDAAAFVQVTGKSELPAIAVGSKVMSGYNEVELVSYLDAAGYPKKSALPSSYVAPSPTPLTTPRAAAPAPAPNQAPAPAPSAPPAAPGTPPGFKF